MIDVPAGRGLVSTAHSERDRAINGRAVRMTVRWVVGLVVVVHGSIHFLGAAKGLGWAEVTQLTEPISAGLGAAWLAAPDPMLGVMFTVTAGLTEACMVNTSEPQLPGPESPGRRY